MKTTSKLQFITTNAATAELACKGGADWIQLRIKDITYEKYREEALKTQAVCKKYGATLIINDNARLALDIGADGVHLGKTDVISPEEEAALFSGNFIVGRTTNTAADIDELKGKYVHYVGLGPYRFTGTKKNLSPILGLDGYKAILAHLKASYPAHPPIIAIGGIIQYDIPSLLDAGAIANAVDITAKTADFVEVINKPKLEPKDEHSISDAIANSDLIGKITGFLTDL